jgi:excisionase family DNA binding protein
MALTGTRDYASVRSANLEQLLTVAQCCELLQVSKQTLYRLINSGELAPIRVGHHPRFTREDVRVYVERHREERAP